MHIYKYKNIFVYLHSHKHKCIINMIRKKLQQELTLNKLWTKRSGNMIMSYT